MFNFKKYVGFGMQSMNMGIGKVNRKWWLHIIFALKRRKWA